MKPWVRWTLVTLAVLAVAAAAAVAAGTWLAERKMARRVEVAVAAVALPTEAAALERGRYLFTTRGCADCHAADGAGRTVIDKDGMKIAGPHIGNGSGSVTARYEIADWVRAVRHGVAPGGRPLFIMPSQDYNRLTDADLGALVAYIKQLPAASARQAGGAAVLQLPLPVRVLYGYGAIRDAAAIIDHRLPPEKPVPEGATVEHGRYVAQMCIGCHGAGYGGGKVPGAPPDWPAAANLTPGEGSAMVRYADAAAFARMMRTGQRPDGSKVAVMPFEALAAMSDVDLEGMYRYLKSLPPRAAGSR
ncbi:MAG: cytochrome c [Burkholderiales bacterium]|nr:cytochrome c [Burkholderiales bacterium]